MVVICDTREKFIDRIKEIIIDIPDAPQFSFKALDFGDYHLKNGSQELRIERKSVNDFCGSYGVLKPRLHKMRLNYQHTALLIEGVYSVNGGMVCVLEGRRMQPRMNYKTMSNFLTHQAAAGTWMFHTMNFEESVNRIIAIHDYLPKLNTPETIKCGNPSEWIAMLPGMGRVSLEKLRNKNSSPLDALNNLPKRSKRALESW
jgi:ERCC4-type nuclease